MFKREFLDKIVKRQSGQVLAFKGDTDVLEEMQKAVKACVSKMDAQFYELPADYLGQAVERTATAAKSAE